MSEPRFHVSPNIADGLVAERVYFCDQVGKSDIYVSDNLVIEVNRHWDETISASDFGRGYAYKHAVLKYPRIAHKLRAMRAMLWGKTDEV